MRHLYEALAIVDEDALQRDNRVVTKSIHDFGLVEELTLPLRRVKRKHLEHTVLVGIGGTENRMVRRR